MKTIKALLVIVMAIATIIMAKDAFAAGEVCTKYCNPAKSTPCGNACIAIGSNCHKNWTTACVGIKPASAKGVFKPNEIKHVNSVPTK